MSEEFLDTIWKDHPEYIRKYYDNLPKYEKLCSEVKYIITTKVNSEVEVAHISSRAKTLKSFCEKISRKNYDDPFQKVTDFSGVRIVYLYPSDKTIVEKIIEKEFLIIEKVDKVSTEKVDTFGYGALHYLVKMKKNNKGARYDELKELICEIQIRTILQDAWAIVAHHLSYKQESDVPTVLRRKLHALSGLFETADDQFENIRNKRIDYQDKVSNSISKNNKNDLLQEPLNLDNLIAFLSWKYPERHQDSGESMSSLLDRLKSKFDTLIEVDRMLDNTKECFEELEKKYPPNLRKGEIFTAVGVVRMSMVRCSGI